MCYSWDRNKCSEVIFTENRIYLCIDLKSFYASAECAARGLDPFEANLVVADPSRGRGAICLAVTPAMKARGVRNRCRLFEIPPSIDYIIAVPRMRMYMQISAQIFGIYQRYISPEDIHVYSVDECFLDATPYLALYHTDPRSLAQMLRDAVLRETGITATAGIGTNLFLAKIALDITAKHVPDGIGVLDAKSFRETIWHHRPITDIWSIGRGTAARLEKLGVYDLHGITQLPEDRLYRVFGKNARYLIDHANGEEPCTIAQIHAYRPKQTSFSNSQILFRDYTAKEAWVVLEEMIDSMALKLVEQRLAAGTVSLSVSYSKDIAPRAGGSRVLENHTQSYRKLIERFAEIYHQCVREDLPIRKLAIACGNLKKQETVTFSLFDDLAAQEKEERLQNARVLIRQKYGKNALLKAVSYTPAGTARLRNQLIGGHNSGES